MIWKPQFEARLSLGQHLLGGATVEIISEPVTGQYSKPFWNLIKMQDDALAQAN